MPLPLALPMAIQGAAGLMQFIGGASKLMQKRPEYEIPPALRESLSLAKIKAADPKMAGYTQAKENVDLVAANTLQAAGESGNAQQALAGVTGEQMKMYRDLASQNEVSQEQDVANLQNTLGQVADAQDMQFQMNEFAPYSDNQQEGRHMVGAGLENVFGAADKFGISSLFGSSGGFGGATGGATGGVTGATTDIYDVANLAKMFGQTGIPGVSGKGKASGGTTDIYKIMELMKTLRGSGIPGII